MTTRPRPSIVIADNNEFHRRVMGDFYRDAGYDVRVAVDGLEALEMIQERRPDLLLLDLIMPRFDGARLCSYLKERDEYRALPIIILSGILADEIEGVESIRADAYVAKMPLEQVGRPLQDLSEALVSGRSAGAPALLGFEKMSRREVVLELLQERKASHEILDSLSEGIVELSTERRLLSCNRAFEQMIGASSCDLVSRPVEEILPQGGPLLGGLFDEVDAGAALAAGVVVHGERELQIKVHRYVPGLARGAAPAGSGAPPLKGGVHHAVELAARTAPKVQLRTMIASAGYTILAEDITQRAKAERERERLRARLAHSEKMSAIGLFVAGAAHELNNPLTSVLGYAQLLAQRETDPDQRRDIERIAAGADRCKKIVENLMAFARANRPEKVLCDLGTLLREALGAFDQRLKESAVSVTLEIAPGLPSTLADPEQIHQAFLAILDNAFRALSGQPGERRLAVAMRAEGGRILTRFADSGPGIPEPILARVFEPFFTTRQVGQGAGLGLSVAYGMVTAHAGRIAAANRPEGGAVVTIELPILRGEAVSPSSPAPAAAPWVADDSRRRILIVDDEEIVLDLLVEILEEGRHRIETAADGREGLRRIQEGDYDLVILDLKMPDMTGQQMFEELQRRRPDVIPRILFMTADTVTPEVESFLRRVRRPCLLKPFAIDTVLESVGRILGASTRS